MRLERRTHVPTINLLMAPVWAILAALLPSGLLILSAGVNPFDAYLQIAVSAVGSRLSITETLARATPLILTGLAASVAFRVRLWNIGGEGQFYLGALTTAAIGHSMLSGVPVLISIFALLLAGAGVGALILFGPVLLRLRFGVDEVVTTLLLNFIIILFVSMMIEGPLKDPLAFGWPQSVPVSPEFKLPKLVPRTRLHIGFIIAVVAAILVWAVNAKTVFGFESRAAGLNPRAASFSGISLSKILILVSCLSGGLAGLAGALEVTGIKGYVTTDLSPGYGYSGIVVATLAAQNPIGVIGAALFVAILFVGADGMSRALGVPTFIADVIVAISLLTMLISVMLTNYRVRL
ncbi:MAG: ABC transporter permease [Alphaproteobacteria bacterium]|nr:ABC transporter permease [Alphaproteobacteria bacterium]